MSFFKKNLDDALKEASTKLRQESASNLSYKKLIYTFPWLSICSPSLCFNHQPISFSWISIKRFFSVPFVWQKPNQLMYTAAITIEARYIKVKVEHYLLFMCSPPKISQTILGIKYICLHFFTVFYLIQPSSKQICFDFGKQNIVLPIVFYVPCLAIFLSFTRIHQ